MILFLASSFILGSAHHIEYNIQFSIINNTAQSDAINVKYFIIFHNISITVQNHFLTEHLYIWVFQSLRNHIVFQSSVNGLHQAPGISSVTIVVIDHDHSA